MKKALVVDDTKNIRRLLTTCLELNDYEVDSCGSGYEALNELDNKEYDLIFLDVKMPGMSGTELLKQIRAKGIEAKVIMITAFATVKNAIECTKLGVVEYLHKPFTMDKITNVLSKIEESNYDSELDTIMQGARKLIENEKYEEGIMFLKKAIAKEPSRSEIYSLLAQCYYGKGEEDIGDKFNECSKVFS
ncbi:response regulator [Clostridium paraputrificum]|uniref:response regulator n=1 Tax=Clostridium TaxID=1485 RepID=UPI003D341FB9